MKTDKQDWKQQCQQQYHLQADSDPASTTIIPSYSQQEAGILRKRDAITGKLGSEQITCYILKPTPEGHLAKDREKTIIVEVIVKTIKTIVVEMIEVRKIIAVEMIEVRKTITITVIGKRRNILTIGATIVTIAIERIKTIKIIVIKMIEWTVELTSRH